MTTHVIVAVLDLATQTYGRIFTVPHSAAAIRSFNDEVNNPESEIAKHPDDYELWSLGSFQDADGSLDPQPVRLVRAVDLKKAQ